MSSQTANNKQEETEALNVLGAVASKIEHEDDEEEFHIPQRFTKSGRKRAVPFPLKLMKVLSTKEFNDIITWMPSGQSFSILKPKAFVAEILPEHFKSAKYSSFTRKLHRWGFMRHYRGEEAGAFYHKDFQRDRLDLVEKMTCHKVDPPKPTTTAPTIKNESKQATQAPKPAVIAKPTARRLAPRAISAAPKINTTPPLNLQRPEVVAAMQKPLPGVVARENPALGTAESLNAAIELEVTRRLKERIQAAAMSRHALALMTQQIPAPTPTPHAFNWSRPAGNLQAQLLLQHKARSLDPACLAFANMPRIDSLGLGQLPPKKIQGAKTA